ncbi:Dystrobrevin-1 [Echinococcus granulosus]|uniref:Dystrobrevin-1 n=1 Tax=Echinococcus granulosus TaxID=6210 RepID=W6UHD0_ECHGR|nr:Dystrobrevin-1 [Echinococcus granulosus]EUB57477.1 Dystrobrevin-1 [Echinococcus granulosus]
MQGPQSFQQITTSVTASAPTVPSKEQSSNLFYASNGSQMLMAPQLSPTQHPQQPAHMYPVNATAVDASNAALAGFRRLLAELKAKKFDQIRFAAYRTASKLRYIQKRTLLRRIRCALGLKLKEEEEEDWGRSSIIIVIIFAIVVVVISATTIINVIVTTTITITLKRKAWEACESPPLPVVEAVVRQSGFVSIVNHTACALRGKISSIELWRLLETFRELGLHSTDPSTSLNRQGTEHLLNRIYTALVPLYIEKGIASNETGAQFAMAQAGEILLGWLTYILDPTNCGRLAVSGLKVALSTLATGRPIDKFTYHYSLLVNSAGVLQIERLEAYLQELLSLAVGVFEEPNFSYNSQTSKFLFTGCEGCKREPIVGLRYKCTRCPRYNLCQDCFWTGITTDPHTNSHDVKEYTSATKTHSRQFGHSLRKSFQFGRQQSMPTGQTVQPTPQQQQQQQKVANTMGAVRPPQQAPFASFPQYRLCRPGLPASMLQSSGMPPTFYYSVPAPGSAALARPPPTPVMQTRAFHRATSVPLQSQAPLPPPPQAPQQQAVFPPGFNATTVQPLPSLGRDALPTPMVVARGANMSRQQIQSQRHLSTTQAPVQRQQLSGLPSQRQLSTDGGEVGTAINASTTPTTVGYCGVVAAPGNSDASIIPPKSMVDGTLGRKHIQHATQQQQYPLEGGLFRQMSAQASLGHPDEHKMIASYAARLVASRTLSGQAINDAVGSTQSQRELVAQLEAKNREILLEIQRLKMEQANQTAGIAAAMGDSGIKLPPTGMVQPQLPSSDVEDPQLVAELNALRQRKSELEARMNDLQGNRRDLTIQLETLMRLLKTSPGQLGKLNEDLTFGPPYHQQNYSSRPRTANAMLPRRSCSLIRRSSGTRASLEALTNETGHQRSLGTESLLTTAGMNEQTVGNTMSLQRRGSNRLLSPQHQMADVSHKSRPRNLSHSVGPATGALLRGSSTAMPVTSVMEKWQGYPGISGRGTDVVCSPEPAHGSILDSKERTAGNSQHSSKVTLELSGNQGASNTRQCEALSISVRSQQCRSPLSGVGSGAYSAESDCGESSQTSRRRPFNCAAAFESPGGSGNMSSSTDAYLYSDPEMLGTGWQDSSGGRRNQFNNTNKISVTTTASTSNTGVDQTSSVTVVSAPGASASVNSIEKKLSGGTVTICESDLVA